LTTRDAFVAERQPRWVELEQLLQASSSLEQGDNIARVAALYREICADLMQVQSLGFGPDLRRRLDALAARSNNFLYRTPRHRWAHMLQQITREFPRTVREQWAFVAASSLLFWLPFAIGVIGALSDERFAERVLPAEMLEQMSEAYSKGFGEGRSEGMDAAMTGFYVYNNIGIAFRCFATGILFGAGSLFFLVYNGLVTGTVLGYVAASGHGRNILTFVCGHSSLELTAIVLSGAAGLMIGHSLLDTRGLTRLGSLRQAGKPAFNLVLGSAGLLALAALVEGFWSPSGAADAVKWIVAAAIAVLVFGYLILGGRGSAGAPA
jgi:uncharacterized membrane protein SpoIIM required for sporulation